MSNGWAEFPPVPEPLAVPVVDSHTHLDVTVEETGRTTVEALLDRAVKAGVDRIVQVGVDVPSSRWGADLAARDDRVLASVAIHPNDAPSQSDLDGALREIEAMAAEPRVRGIGETGLDTYRTGEDGRAAQEASFRAHIAIAKRYGRALIIHDRDAHADVLRVLDSEGAPDTVILHCFSGDAEFAAECVRRGCLLSFAGTVTFANARDLRAAASLSACALLNVTVPAKLST